MNDRSPVAWFDPVEVYAMLARNEIRDGLSLTGLLWYFASAGGLLR